MRLPARAVRVTGGVFLGVAVGFDVVWIAASFNAYDAVLRGMLAGFGWIRP